MRSLLQDLLQELQNAVQVEEDKYNNLENNFTDYVSETEAVIKYLKGNENLTENSKKKLDILLNL